MRAIIKEQMFVPCGNQSLSRYLIIVLLKKRRNFLIFCFVLLTISSGPDPFGRIYTGKPMCFSPATYDVCVLYRIELNHRRRIV